MAFDSVVLTAPMPDSFASAVQCLALRLPAIETRWGLQCVVHADVIVCACLVQPTSFFILLSAANTLSNSGCCAAVFWLYSVDNGKGKMGAYDVAVLHYCAKVGCEAPAEH